MKFIACEWWWEVLEQEIIAAAGTGEYRVRCYNVDVCNAMLYPENIGFLEDRGYFVDAHDDYVDVGWKRVDD